MDTRGVVVEDVDPDGPAARAGLRRSDIILEANRKELENLEGLEKALQMSDENVVLLLQRGESTLYLAIERE